MQLEQLRENNRTMVEEVRPLAREYRELHRGAQTDAPNESIIGIITMEIIEINGEMEGIRARYQESARAFLNRLQLEALKPIEVAAARVCQVRQATQFNLVEFLEQDGPDNEQGGRRQLPGTHR